MKQELNDVFNVSFKCGKYSKIMIQKALIIGLQDLRLDKI